MNLLIKDQVLVTLRITVFVTITALLGNNASDFPILFLLLSYLILYHCISFFWVELIINKVGHSIWNIFVREDIDGAWERSLAFRETTWYLKFWPMWFLHPLAFLLLTSMFGRVEFYDDWIPILVIGIASADFVTQQIAMNFEWRSTNEIWPYSAKRQIMILIKCLVICPTIIIFIFDQKPYIFSLKIEFWSFFEGWGMYIFWFFGQLFIWIETKKWYLAATSPDKLFQQYFHDAVIGA